MATAKGTITYLPEDVFASSGLLKVHERSDLVRHLLALKFEQPLSDNLYAVNASRARFEPHQFKPAIKFLPLFVSQLKVFIILSNAIPNFLDQSQPLRDTEFLRLFCQI